MGGEVSRYNDYQISPSYVATNQGYNSAIQNPNIQSYSSSYSPSYTEQNAPNIQSYNAPLNTPNIQSYNATQNTPIIEDYTNSVDNFAPNPNIQSYNSLGNQGYLANKGYTPANNVATQCYNVANQSYSQTYVPFNQWYRFSNPAFSGQTGVMMNDSYAVQKPGCGCH